MHPVSRGAESSHGGLYSSYVKPKISTTATLSYGRPQLTRLTQRTIRPESGREKLTGP